MRCTGYFKYGYYSSPTSIIDYLGRKHSLVTTYNIIKKKKSVGCILSPTSNYYLRGLKTLPLTVEPVSVGGY